jgi:hypothetical protein
LVLVMRVTLLAHHQFFTVLLVSVEALEAAMAQDSGALALVVARVSHCREAMAVMIAPVLAVVVLALLEAMLTPVQN